MNRRETDIGLESIRIADRLQNVRSPIAASAIDYPDGSVCPPHSHRRAQLIYATSGVMTVYSSDGARVVPSIRGVWVPPGIEHSILNSGLVRLRTLYIEPSLTRNLPKACTVVRVSVLLRELLNAAFEISLDRTPKGRHELIMRLILDEIRTVPTLPLHLPVPERSLITRICKTIIDQPGEPHTLEAWASRLGVSSRTLERHFEKETGMKFSRWRQQARLIGSLPRLARGESILGIALDLGYESPSAFAAMFRRALGTTPSAYFAEAANDLPAAGR